VLLDTQHFPFAPPFVRVVSPVFAFHTGHITIGGSICMEILTNSGWSCAIAMESVFVSIRAEIASGGARLDLGRFRDAYSESEARAAFKRVAMAHGWER
jgi:ubiquitin-conjugating enzyme E2 Q